MKVNRSLGPTNRLDSTGGITGGYPAN